MNDISLMRREYNDRGGKLKKINKYLTQDKTDFETIVE